jgi:uncharacterized protein YdeI (YjbR/CyaY-like superfamily)
MNRTNPRVDIYLTAGCGRCPLGNTPACKVHHWTEELTELREIALGCGLTEEFKWSTPCYTFQDGNIVLLGAFKEYCVISFFKGALLTDAAGILIKPGENTQAGRVIRFTDVQKIRKQESILKAYIDEAVEVEKAGLKVDFKKTSEFNLPDELQKTFAENTVFKNAFKALTPGRQRGYILYFSQPKQSKTREARIEKSMPQIFLGKGLHDR